MQIANLTYHLHKKYLSAGPCKIGCLIVYLLINQLADHLMIAPLTDLIPDWQLVSY